MLITTVLINVIHVERRTAMPGAGITARECRAPVIMVMFMHVTVSLDVPTTTVLISVIVVVLLIVVLDAGTIVHGTRARGTMEMLVLVTVSMVVRTTTALISAIGAVLPIAKLAVAAIVSVHDDMRTCLTSGCFITSSANLSFLCLYIPITVFHFIVAILNPFLGDYIG